MSEDLQYPIGKYQPESYSDELKEQWLADIRYLPDALEAAISNLSEEQLQTPYREGGWTVHQVVHHVADSHMNAYIRCKLCMTENEPTIKPYDENAWSRLEDVKQLPVNISITLLFALHRRWYEFLKSVKGDDWNRTVIHPQHGKKFTLWELLGSYSWHGRHHTAHITKLRERNNW